MAVSLFPAVQRAGSYRATIDGGIGNDHLFGLVNPGPCEPGSSVGVSFVGGMGNDQIAVAADLTGLTPESGRVAVGIDAGDGSDQILFLVRGIERPMENAVFLLDGGAGRDAALISQLVQVQNTELVDYI